MAKVTSSFTLDDQSDRDILTWLDRLPKRKKSEAIREVLRAHLRGRGVTLSDIYQAVREIDRKLASGAVIVGTGEVDDAMDTNEPPDVAAALDSLGL
jgi:hypothetical protein